jgi:hypothetical protein
MLRGPLCQFLIPRVPALLSLQYDFPEELSTLQRMGKDAGFSSVRSVFQASKGLSAVVVFKA